MICRYCKREITGGKGDYWHVISGEMTCNPNVALGKIAFPELQHVEDGQMFPEDNQLPKHSYTETEMDAIHEKWFLSGYKAGFKDAECPCGIDK